jgi:hypothetical protein
LNPGGSTPTTGVGNVAEADETERLPRVHAIAPELVRDDRDAAGSGRVLGVRELTSDDRRNSQSGKKVTRHLERRQAYRLGVAGR